MAASPTARSLQYCHSHGLPASVVERWNPHAKIRQDAFGFIDLIVLDTDAHAIIGVQATSASNHAARRRKILAEPKALAWSNAGGLIEVWSWSKRAGVTKRKVWTLRREEVCP